MRIKINKTLAPYDDAGEQYTLENSKIKWNKTICTEIWRYSKTKEKHHPPITTDGRGAFWGEFQHAELLAHTLKYIHKYFQSSLTITNQHYSTCMEKHHDLLLQRYLDWLRRGKERSHEHWLYSPAIKTEKKIDMDNLRIILKHCTQKWTVHIIHR